MISIWALPAIKAIGIKHAWPRSPGNRTPFGNQASCRKLVLPSAFAATRLGGNEAMVRWGDSSKTPAVLIVEDEPLVRLNAVRAIEDAGFEVIEAANADEAIRILENRSDFRVVFTDIQMPGSIDGLKLAHAVRNRWPPIKIIVTSGHDLVSENDLPEGGRFFAKPYDSTQITNTIRELTR